MNNSWKTLCFALGTTLCSTASADDSQMSSSSEPMKKPCLTIPSSAAPRIDNNFNLTVSGAALWWKSVQAGREYAQLSPSTTTTSTVQTIPYKWDVGFRVGVGYELSRDGWDLEATWTRFFNNGSQSLNNPSQIRPLDSNLFDMALYSASTAHMRSKMNLVDLTIGRDFYVGRHTTLYPFAGLRGQWIMQKEKYAFFSADNVAGNSAHISNRHAGLGPIVGFSMDWMFGYGLSVYGNMAAALIYGYMNIDAQYYNEAGTAFLGFVNDKNHHGTIIPDGDLTIGLKWDHTFSRSVYMALSVGWEQHFFLDQWRWHNATSSAANPFSGGNTLATQGLTGSLRFEF